MTTEEVRVAALAAAARVHEGVGATSKTVLNAAEKFEEYIRTGQISRSAF